MTWQSTLLHWYWKNRRDLPWRTTKDPYRVWVSEIMLQQTTVVTVIPYYHRFLKRFPTLNSLARAREESVLRMWSGLGYYSRARNLHKASKLISSKKAGPLTSEVEDLQKLPGIGRYTAGAIASIAFDHPAPILDGNVIRVLSRIFGMKKNPKSTEGQKVFWKKAEAVLPKKKCGDFNQALMELGAIVCHPESPACFVCPLSDMCVAKKEGRERWYPRGKKKVHYQDVTLSAAIVLNKGRLFMIRRPNQGVLKNMWEFPMVEGDASRLVSTYGVKPQKSYLPVRHSVLNRRLLITPFLCATKGCQVPFGRWFRPKEILKLSTSSMNKKILFRSLHLSL